jgi:hypothetical protein
MKLYNSFSYQYADNIAAGNTNLSVGTNLIASSYSKIYIKHFTCSIHIRDQVTNENINGIAVVSFANVAGSNYSSKYPGATGNNITTINFSFKDCCFFYIPFIINVNDRLTTNQTVRLDNAAVNTTTFVINYNFVGYYIE